MAVSKPLDYRVEELEKDGRVVDGFRVSGLLAELGLVVTRTVGTSALESKHLPAYVELELDGYRGAQKVQALDKDRDRAVAVAKALRRELHKHGLAVLDVVRRARGGVHDLVLEYVDAPPNTVWKLISCELKCRRLWSENGRQKVRRAFERECVDQCSWWNDEVQTGRWSGRLVVLAEFPMSGDGFVLRGDFFPVLSTCAYPIFGWKYSHHNLPRPKPLPGDTPGVAVTNVVMPKRAFFEPPKKKALDDVMAAIVGKGLFRVEGGVLVAPIKDMLSMIGRPVFHIGRRIERWKERCPNGRAFCAKRKSSKAGGKPEYVATKEMLEAIYRAV
jgi:hypothetical protein